MRIVIIGCGRMGAALAQSLSGRGHEVTVVDCDPSSFERLGSSFRGVTVSGGGFDREALLKAGIERADGLAAVTASDEVNAVAARLARQVFHVPKVVARIYDPRKAEIFQSLGLQNISPETWGINRIVDLLCYSRMETVTSLGNGEVDIVEVEVPHLLVGRTVNELTVIGEIHVVAVSRQGKTFLPTRGTELHKGDLIHLALLAVSTDRLKELLGWL
ncbi:MAG: NAD-binding protein [Geobacteraceae bacterium]|nr:NAD-binding protein [Geobacteraceae bacterium]